MLDPCCAALADWARHHAIRPREEAPMAVAFSGGADSTALLWAAQCLWPGSVLALHVHHGLQSAADGFERHVRTICAALDLPLRVAHRHAHAAAGESPEAAARDHRYRALADLAQPKQGPGAVAVLLGQHADDQVETVMLALSRGAGLPGLAAMSAYFVRHGCVFGRPLLGLAPSDLRRCVLAQGLDFVEDPSNQDLRYTRNRIRAQLLPAWQAGLGPYRLTIARSARHAAQAQLLLEQLALIDQERTGLPPALTPLRDLARERQANLLRHWLRHGEGRAASEAQLAELLDQIAACSSRGHQIRLRVADGFVVRDGPCLLFHAGMPPEALPGGD